jgi:hypothetical protein
MVTIMPKWPWSREEPDAAEAKRREQERIKEARSEALRELQASQRQLDKVRDLSNRHQPVRKELHELRKKNNFAEGFLRIIEEGR